MNRRRRARPSVVALLSCAVGLNQFSPALAQVPYRAVHPAPVTAAESHSDVTMCRALGRNDGLSLSTRRAFAVGLVSGLTLGLIGTGVAYVTQNEPEPSALSVAGYDGECATAYRAAYGEAGKTKNRKAALHGGLVGTAVFGVIIFAVIASRGVQPVH